MKRFLLSFSVCGLVIVLSAAIRALPVGILIIVSLATAELVHTLYRKDLSKLRSVLTVVMTYVCVTILYGYLYYFLPEEHICPGFAKSWEGVINAIYFSSVTITTLGYGDYKPVTSVGRLIVVSQLVVGIFTIVLGVNYIISKEERKETV